MTAICQSQATNQQAVIPNGNMSTDNPTDMVTEISNRNLFDTNSHATTIITAVTGQLREATQQASV